MQRAIVIAAAAVAVLACGKKVQEPDAAASPPPVADSAAAPANDTASSPNAADTAASEPTPDTAIVPAADPPAPPPKGTIRLAGFAQPYRRAKTPLDRRCAPGPSCGPAMTRSAAWIGRVAGTRPHMELFTEFGARWGIAPEVIVDRAWAVPLARDRGDRSSRI